MHLIINSILNCFLILSLNKRFNFVFFFLYFAIICNLSIAQEQNSENNSQAKRFHINGYIDYLTNSEFNSYKYGTNLEYLFLSKWETNFMFESKFHHRITDSNYNFPTNLYHLDFGLKSHGKNVLIGGEIGSRSDQLFHSTNEINYMGYAFYNVLDNPNHFLFIGVFYERSIQLLGYQISYQVPVPLILYIYQGKNFKFKGLLPFELEWKLSNKLIFFLSSEENIRLTYHFTEEFNLGGELCFVDEDYLIANRGNINDTLYYQGYKAGIRLTYSFISGFFGYGFNYEYYTQHNKIGYFNSFSKTNRKALNDSFQDEFLFIL